MSVYEWIIGAWTTLVIYCIGLYYTLVEFFNDRFSVTNRSYVEYLRMKIESSGFRRCSIAREHPIAVVTGASGTIGYEIVRQLLNLGYKVEAIAREAGCLTTLKDVRLSIHLIDMGDLIKVRRVADEIVGRAPEGIDLLVCNAGIMFHHYEVNAAGHEQHMAVNLLSHALLIDVLLSSMRNATHPIRIICVSSSTAHAVHIDDTAIQNGGIFARYVNGYHAYALSKLSLALYAEQLNRYLEEELLERDTEKCRIKVCSVHPGCVPGDLYRNVFYPCRILINYLLSPFMRKAAVAAAEILATVMNDDLKGGCYYERMESVALRPDISDTVRRRLFNRIQQTVHYSNF